MKISVALIATAAAVLPFNSAFAQSKKGGAAATPAAPAAAASSSSASSAPFEEQMLSLAAMDKVAARIAQDICDKTPASNQRVIIYDQTAFTNVQAFLAFRENAKSIVQSYLTLEPDEKAQTKALQTVLALRKSRVNDETTLQKMVYARADNVHGATQRVQAFLDNAQSFGQIAPFLSALAVASNTQTAGAVSIPDSAMATAVLNEVRARANKNSKCPMKSIGYPPSMGVGSTTDLSSVAIQTVIQEVNDYRTVVHADVDSAYREVLKGGSTAPRVDVVASAAVADIDALYDSFINTLLQANANGAIGSTSIIQGYELLTFLNGDTTGVEENVQCAKMDKDKPIQSCSLERFDTFGERDSAFNDAKSCVCAGPPATARPLVVLASVVTAGGTQYTRKNFLTSVFWGDIISYSGGIAVNEMIWQPTSPQPLITQVLRYRTDFKKMDKPAGEAKGDVETGANFDQPAKASTP